VHGHEQSFQDGSVENDLSNLKLLKDHEWEAPLLSTCNNSTGAAALTLKARSTSCGADEAQLHIV